MDAVYTLALGLMGGLYAGEALRAWRRRRIVKLETELLDQELDML